MNYQEFSEESGLTYEINRVHNSIFVTFYDSFRNKVFEISRELGATFFELHDFRSPVYINQSLVIEFLSAENQDDWFRYHEKPKMIEVNGIKLTKSEAKTLYEKLSKRFKKEV